MNSTVSTPNPKAIDRGLFVYGSLTAIAVSTISYYNLHTTGGLIIFLLFLPISLYFLIFGFLYIKRLLLHFLNDGQPKHRYFDRFSFKMFLNQSEIVFLLTKFLITAAIATLLFKISFQLLSA